MKEKYLYLQKKAALALESKAIALRLHFSFAERRRKRKYETRKQQNTITQKKSSSHSLLHALRERARKLGVPYIEIYERMRKVDLIKVLFCPTTIRPPKVESIL